MEMLSFIIRSLISMSIITIVEILFVRIKIHMYTYICMYICNVYECFLKCHHINFLSQSKYSTTKRSLFL